MLYIVEMALSPGHTDTQWYQWTSDMKSGELLMTVPGFLSSQRFKGISDPLAYCGIYSIREADVMTSAAYKGVGGGVRVEHWNSHITYWNRDIVDGVALAPAVPKGYVLVVRNSEQLYFRDEGVPFIRLRTVGLNRSVAFKGIAVLPKDEGLAAAARHPELRLYAPTADQLITDQEPGARPGF